VLIELAQAAAQPLGCFGVFGVGGRAECVLNALALAEQLAQLDAAADELAAGLRPGTGRAGEKPDALTDPLQRTRGRPLERAVRATARAAR